VLQNWSFLSLTAMRETGQVQIGDVDQPGQIEVRRAENRLVSAREGITTRHCFSFGDQYDAANVSFGPLIALNDELLDPGAGYPAHRHRDVDIVTWVLEGTLVHEDSTGTRATIRNGTAQRLTAGTGITHSESNGGGPGERLRFVQLWFAIGGADVSPSYETHTFEDDDHGLGFTTIACNGPLPVHSTTLAVPGVEVAVGHLKAGETGVVGGAGATYHGFHLYVASGCLDTQPSGRLSAGDAVRSTCVGVGFTTVEPTEVVLVRIRAEAQGRSR
jgi:redox-sensitive bicupin YhaK (pirin superfamily)